MSSPLRFHSNHSKTIKTTNNNQTAIRLNQNNFFSRGLLFTNRPIQPNEPIYIKLLNISDNLGGFLYVGFTRHNPINFLPPKFVENTGIGNKPGYWCWFFPQDLCQMENVLYFLFKTNGKIYYGINGIEKGCFDGKLMNTNCPIWGLIDIFGNLNSVEILETFSPQIIQTKFLYQEKNLDFLPMGLNHSIYGKFLEFPAKNIVQRINSHHIQGVGFSLQPINPNEMIVLKILKNSNNYHEKDLYLHLGLTSCNPSKIPILLPDSFNTLLDRPEYWITFMENAQKCHENDEMNFFINQNGEVRLFFNGKLIKWLHIDINVKLFLFFNLFGSKQSVSISIAKYIPPTINNIDDSIDVDRECCVCFENGIDCVLLNCLHKCMCYECALQQWQGKGHGHCPLCRKMIVNVVQVG